MLSGYSLFYSVSLICIVLAVKPTEAVKYNAVNGQYRTIHNVKAFTYLGTDWLIYNHTNTGVAYFYNNETKKTQWTDPRPPISRAWQESKQTIMACFLGPPLVLGMVLLARILYLKVRVLSTCSECGKGMSAAVRSIARKPFFKESSSLQSRQRRGPCWWSPCVHYNDWLWGSSNWG